MSPLCLMVFCTVPSAEKGNEIAQTLVSERLCACVNVVNEVHSFYWWEQKVQKDPESLMILKTTPEGFEPLEKRIKELHPYSVPEILGIPVVKGSEDYLDWVKAETNTPA